MFWGQVREGFSGNSRPWAGEEWGLLLSTAAWTRRRGSAFLPGSWEGCRLRLLPTAIRGNATGKYRPAGSLLPSLGVKGWKGLLNPTTETWKPERFHLFDSRLTGMPVLFWKLGFLFWENTKQMWVPGELWSPTRSLHPLQFPLLKSPQMSLRSPLRQQ